MSGDSLYKSNIIEHYRAPLHGGTLASPTVSADVVNSSCGDEIHLDLLIEDGVIKEVAHDSRGCAISIAAMSMLSDLLIGKSLEGAAKISKAEVFKLVGMEASSGRIKCALLSWDALQEVIKNS